MLYDEKSDMISKSEAYTYMQVWKLRRIDTIPASILSTMAIIEVDLKSETSGNVTELQMMYSNAFTRFLNYMTSINQTGKFKNMYASTRELGLESFLVDLRHICAHGQNTPSLDVLKRTAKYCLSWLKEFYWDRKLKTITSVNTDDLRSAQQKQLLSELNEYFELFDLVNKVIFKKLTNLSQASQILSRKQMKKIKTKNTSELDYTKLQSVADDNISRFINQIKMNKTIPYYKNFALEVLLSKKRNRFFIEMPYHELNSGGCEEHISIRLCQPLFRLLATVDMIDDVLNMLIKIMENRDESLPKRCGASFWADQIIQAFDFNTKLKQVVKTKIDSNPNYKMDLNLINTKNIPKAMVALCEKLGRDSSKHLVIGDSERHPINFVLNKKFVMNRILNINEISANFVRHCIELISEQEVSVEKKSQLMDVISVYINDNTYSTNQLEDTTNLEILELSDENIWRDAPGSLNFLNCFESFDNFVFFFRKHCMVNYTIWAYSSK